MNTQTPFTNNMLTPVVSVIVPTHNRQQTVARAIDSLLAQDTDIAYEVVVVVDGSADGTFELLQHTYPDEIRSRLLRVFVTEHVGVSSARNKGVHESRGTCVAFLDSDDHALPHYISTLAKSLEYGSFVHARALMVDERGVGLNDEYHEDGVPVRGHWAYYWSMLACGYLSTAEILTNTSSAHYGKNPINMQTVIVRKELLQQIELKYGYIFDEQLHFVEDFELWSRLARLLKTDGKENEMIFVPHVVVRYRHGVGHSFRDKKRQRRSKNVCLAKAQLERRGPELRMLILTANRPGSSRVALRGTSEALFESGVTQLGLVQQPSWFGRPKRYSFKRVDNNIYSTTYDAEKYYTQGWKDLASVEDVLQLVRKQRYNVLYIQDNRFADEVDILKQLNIPTVLRLQSLMKYEIKREEHLRRSYLEAVLRQERLLRAVDIIQVQSEEYLKILSTVYPQYKDKARVTRNGPNVGGIEAEHVTQSEPGRMLFVGRLESQKFHDELIDALRLVQKVIPDFRLDVVGGAYDNEREQRVKEIVKASGLTDNVVFQGKKSVYELKKYYERASIYLSPSRHEQVSQALIDASGYELALVISDIPEYEFLREWEIECVKARTIIDGKGQVRVDSVDLAAKITYLIKHPAEAKEYGRMGRDRFDIYSWRAVAENTINQIQGILRREN